MLTRFLHGAFTSSLTIFLVLSVSRGSEAAEDRKLPLKELFAAQQWDDVIKKTEKETGGSPEQQAFQLLARSIALSQKKSWSLLAKTAPMLRQKSPQWEDYSDYLSAQAFYHLNRYRDAREALLRIKRDRTTQKIYTDAQVLLARVALAEGDFAEAKKTLAKFERSFRHQPEYPALLWELARAERGLRQQGAFCKRVLRLYRDYPDAELVSHWGPFFDENKFESRETLCSFGWGDLLVRVRNLLRAGLVERAQKEVDLVVQRAQGQRTFEIDRIRSHFLLHEGDINAALELMAPYFEEYQKDVNFLNMMASSAARAGDSATAIGTYQRITQLVPGSSTGRQALFQAAFLSYQFQDYDGATRRFREFLQKYRSSGLAADAEWHLAWIRYLKGDFARALDEFASLEKKLMSKRRKDRKKIERLKYWMAMAHLRLNQTAPAREIFQQIAKPGAIGGYYSVAAGQRLKQIQASANASVNGAPSQGAANNPAANGATPVVVVELQPDRSPASVLLQSQLTGFEKPDQKARWVKMESESEETIAVSPEAGPEGEVEGEESTEAPAEVIAEAGAEEGAEVEAPAALSSSQDPKIVQRLERARQLISLDLRDFAKWELYEIERKTSNKEYLRALMTEYEKIASYNRSSRIASDAFAAQRINGGLDGQRSFWEKAYPRAHAKHVEEYSRRFGIPAELVWSIMRAESNYRQDAISPVGALGLMQVMPKTGTRIASMLGEKNFEPRSLLEPPSAVKIGSRYLSRMAKMFEGNRALVAASYNAGPHRVQAWLHRFGSLDLDEFIEHIPFVETRNYVKKVMANYQIYSELYVGQREVFPEVAKPITVRAKDQVPTKETWEDI